MWRSSDLSSPTFTRRRNESTYKDQACYQSDRRPCHEGFLSPPQREDPQYGKDESSDFTRVGIEPLRLALATTCKPEQSSLWSHNAEPSRYRVATTAWDSYEGRFASTTLTHAMRQAPMKDEPRYPAGRVICRQLVSKAYLRQR